MNNIPEGDLDETIRKGVKAFKTIYKAATKNQIPKTHDEIIAMQKRLEKEENDIIESQQAIAKIKELQAKRKARERAIKQARRAKLRRFFRI